MERRTRRPDIKCAQNEGKRMRNNLRLEWSEGAARLDRRTRHPIYYRLVKSWEWYMLTVVGHLHNIIANSGTNFACEPIKLCASVRLKLQRQKHFKQIVLPSTSGISC